jgi:hypothetical protein
VAAQRLTTAAASTKRAARPVENDPGSPKATAIKYPKITNAAPVATNQARPSASLAGVAHPRETYTICEKSIWWIVGSSQ